MNLHEEIGMCKAKGAAEDALNFAVNSVPVIPAASAVGVAATAGEEAIVSEGPALKGWTDSGGRNDDDSAPGGTAPCSEEFSTDGAEVSECNSSTHGQPRRASLVLKRVQRRLSASHRSKSDSCILDSSRIHLADNWLKDLDEEVLVEDNTEHAPTGTYSAKESQEAYKRDFPQDDPSPNGKISSSHSAVAQTVARPRRPSCLKNASSSTVGSSRSCGSGSDSSVHFGTIQIREYQRRLSDNPAVTEGPPIGLGWEYNPNPAILPVDAYEDARPIRRQKEEFLMPSRVREEILISEWGVTMRDIRQASHESKEIRERRQRSQKTSRTSERVAELVEVSKRKWRRLKTGTTKETEQELLWKLSLEDTSSTSNSQGILTHQQPVDPTF